jgi:hypothetical protein
MELDPKYCDVIVLRWQAFTGAAAIVEDDGRSYEEIKRLGEVARSHLSP